MNSCNWIGIGIEIEGQVLDLSKSDITSFYRELNMETGILTRHFKCKLENGKEIEVKSFVFLCSTFVAAQQVGLPLNVDMTSTKTQKNGKPVKSNQFSAWVTPARFEPATVTFVV